MVLRMVRSHGWDRHLLETQQSKLRSQYGISDFHAKYTFYDLAYNLRPTEIQGFLGVDQLKYLDEMVQKRAENYAALEQIYENDDFIRTENKTSKNSNFAFPVICKNKKLQEKYIRKCTAAGIEIRPIAGGMTTDQPFYKKYVDVSHHLPNAHFVNEHALYVGNNPELTKKELAHIIKTLSK